MLRCASWEAVSSKRQAAADKVSLEKQRAENEAAIQKVGGVCVARLVVPGESRSIVLFEDACRRVDAYRQLKELVDTRAIDLLVCYTHSRLGREISLCESVIAYCLAGGVAIYDCSLDPVIQKGDVMSAIRSWEAQTEVQRLRGINKHVSLGNFPPGPKPKFWNIEYTREGERVYTINEAEAARAREVIGLYLSGLGMAKIGRSVGLSMSAVLCILDQAPNLAGYVRSTRGGKAITARGKQPAIIDDATMQRVLDARGDRRSNKGANATYIYSRLVTCEVCGKIMHVVPMQSKPANSGKIWRGKALRCACPRWVSFSKLDKEFGEWLSSMSTFGIDGYTQRVDAQQSRLADLQSELTRIAMEKARLITLFTSELIELTKYKVRLTQYQQRELTINSELQQLSTDAQQEQQHVDAMLQLGQLINQQLSTMSTAEVNTLYRSALTVVYTTDRQVDIQFAM